MANNVLKRAVERRETLQTELDQLDEFIRTYRALEAGTSLEAIGAAGGSPSRPEEIQDKVTEILSIREPLTLRAISNSLAARRITVGGLNPMRNLSSILSHSDRFQSERGVGWSRAKGSYTNNENLSTEETFEPPDGTPASPELSERYDDVDDDCPF